MFASEPASFRAWPWAADGSAEPRTALPVSSPVLARDQGARANAQAHPIVLLQGPIGGAFGGLARHLTRLGLPALKIQFNLGDRVMDRAPESLVFDGDLADLGRWYADLFDVVRPRAVIAFGDRRAIHVPARDLCLARSVPFFSFEEGYLRPDFVTFERGGNNALSPLPRTARGIPEHASFPAYSPIGSSFAPMAWAAVGYFPLMWLSPPFFPHYRHHRDRGFFTECFGWIRSLVRKASSAIPDRNLSAGLARTRPKRFFVVALQVFDDLQMLHHGRGWSTERLIEASLCSFAANAPVDHALVVKHHPLDRGHRNYSRLIDKLARRVGVSERVHYLYGGEQALLLRHARGLITINSTMALSAMYHRCPVLVLGDAFYAMPGLVADGTRAGALDAFWRDPPPLDDDLGRRFRALVARQALLNGSFYRPRTWGGLAWQVAERLIEHGVVSRGELLRVPEVAATLRMRTVGA